MGKKNKSVFLLSLYLGGDYKRNFGEIRWNQN
jgi:hypothetical protein